MTGIHHGLLSRSFLKWFKKKKIFCEANPCCMQYGTRVVQYPDGSLKLYCETHLIKEMEPKHENKNRTKTH